MTATYAPTVLTQEQRDALAADFSFGGGSVLRAAIAANPHPELPFIRPARPVTDTDGRQLNELSLLQLDALAQSWSVWYRAKGVVPRDRVAIFLDDTFAYSIHFHALAQIGAVPVMVNSRASREVASHLCRQTAPVAMYTDRRRLMALGGAGGLAELGVRWVEVAEDVPAPPAATLPESDRYRHAPEDPVSILHSSGTTGRPKPVIQTHQSSVAGPRFRLQSHREEAGAVMMTALPQAHLGCIAYSIYAVLGGTPLVPLCDPSGAELGAAVHEYRPTAVMSFSHAYGELAAQDVPPGALDSVSAWITIGDAIHEAHIRTILGHRSADRPPASFYDRLGTTELGWGVLLHVRTLASERRDRCVGRPTGVAEVAVLRKDGTEAATGEYGLLGAKGPAVTAGYWNDADTTYRSRLAGYWLTGDVAMRDADGFYYQVDRAVDAIETPTHTGYSVFMEEVILSDVPAISDCTVIAGRHGERAVPVAVVRTTSEGVDPRALLAEANDALRSAGHPELGLLEVARSDADMPLGVTGKVLKRQLRERYADLASYIGQDADRALAVAS